MKMSRWEWGYRSMPARKIPLTVLSYAKATVTLPIKFCAPLFHSFTACGGATWNAIGHVANSLTAQKSVNIEQVWPARVVVLYLVFLEYDSKVKVLFIAFSVHIRTHNCDVALNLAKMPGRYHKQSYSNGRVILTMILYCGAISQWKILLMKVSRPAWCMQAFFHYSLVSKIWNTIGISCRTLWSETSNINDKHWSIFTKNSMSI